MALENVWQQASEGLHFFFHVEFGEFFGFDAEICFVLGMCPFEESFENTTEVDERAGVVAN